MIKVFNRLFVGNLSECFENKEGWVTIHACKSPCHQRAVGYKGNLAAIHPNYLVLEKENNLYLNLIDPPFPLFKKESFEAFLRFAKENYEQKKNIFVHCNKGESRAPSLAMLFMAKVVKDINNDSYYDAREEFKKLCASCNPGQGIQIFLAENWDVLN